MIARLLLLCSLIFVSSCNQADPKDSRPIVVVSVAPYRAFVERIAGDTVRIETIVPEGESPHSVSTTAKHTALLTNSKIWFHLGEEYEMAAIATFGEHVRTPFVNVRTEMEKQGGKLIYGSCCHHHGKPHTHDSHDTDPHIWLSPSLAAIQAKIIAEQLVETFPEHKALYLANLANLLADLKTLDSDLATLCKQATIRKVLVSHAAFAYFCRDYTLTQLSLESEGRETSGNEVTKLIRQAKSDGITTVFAVRGYNDQAARAVADAIGAKIASIDPYAFDYFVEMRRIATLFSGV